MASLLPGYDYSARAVDKYDNTTPAHTSRGHGGVACIWKQELTPFIKQTEEGNERVLPVLISIPKSVPICLINCYLPSGESRTAFEEYANTLIMIQDIIESYMDTHSILITGDLNVDLLQRDGKNERIIKKMMKDLSLRNHNTCTSIMDCPTYEHKNGLVKSHLDYFISDGRIKWSNTSVVSKSSYLGTFNCSTHNPIHIFTKDLGHIQERRENKVTKSSQARINWDKTDKDRYQEVLTEEIAKVNFELLDNTGKTAMMSNLMNTAAMAADASSKGTRKKRRKSQSNRPWSPRIASAAEEAKIAFWKWKELGRPPKPHPLANRKREKTQKLRSAQRQESARRRKDLLKEIMCASEKDSKLFHKLVKANRSRSTASPALKDGNKLVFDEENQRLLWADYFQNLSSQQGYKEEATDSNTIKLLRLATENNNNGNNSYDDYDVTMAIRRLNKNRAPDLEGITAEHLQYAPPECISVITNIINSALDEGKCPASFKSGFKIPIAKKGKDSTILSNYRGITITALIGKILEQLIQISVDEVLHANGNMLQFGFTQGLSPVMATLCLNEGIAHCKEHKKELYVGALDAQKAFDVVNHQKLKLKLHMAGVEGKKWQIIDDLYDNIEEKVRWNGDYSRTYYVKQGVRQGAVLSTSLYKLYIDDLLNKLSVTQTGLNIGNIYIGIPTCADDQLLLSDKGYEMKAMVKTCQQYAEEHLYTIHPTKSTVTIMNRTTPATTSLLESDDIGLPTTSSFTHLGLEWSSGCTTPNIELKISMARRTAYALTSLGLHGENGLSPATSLKIINTYVIPRLLYGVEALVLSKQQIKDISAFHKNLLRRIQGLPKNTATEAIYIMLGTLPIEAEIHIRALTLFGAVCRSRNTTLVDLANRQLGLGGKHSWFTYIQKLCCQYQINIEGATNAPWRKNHWKEYVTDTVKHFWMKELMLNKSGKSSLQYLEIDLRQPFKPHAIWRSCTGNPRHVTAAMIRAKMITNTYLTQERKTKLGRIGESAMCILCGEENETLQHLLISCSSLNPGRTNKLDMLKRKGFNITEQQENPVKALLNGPAQGSSNDGDKWAEIQLNITMLCQQLTNTRNKLLELKNRKS